MNQKISILGCGWLGLPLASNLVKIGLKVNGSTTRKTRLETLAINGIQPFLIDISKTDCDYTAFLKSTVLVVNIPSKSISDFEFLIEQIEKSEVQKVVLTSSTSVYPNTNGIVTERTPINNSALAQIERLFSSNSGFECTLIRFGGLFGYDRKPGRFIKPNKELSNPQGYVNLIHRNDCIEIIKHIITKNIWGQVFNACASSHPMRHEFYSKEAKKLGINTISFNTKVKSDYKIVSNRKLKELLDYQFLYDDLMDY